MHNKGDKVLFWEPKKGSIVGKIVLEIPPFGDPYQAIQGLPTEKYLKRRIWGAGTSKYRSVRLQNCVTYLVAVQDDPIEKAVLWWIRDIDVKINYSNVKNLGESQRRQ